MYAVRAIFNCSRFAFAGNLNLVKNQPCCHAKKVKCSSTSKRVRAHKSRQKTLRLDTYSKSRNIFVPPARAKRQQWKAAFNFGCSLKACLYCENNSVKTTKKLIISIQNNPETTNVLVVLPNLFLQCIMRLFMRAC